MLSPRLLPALLCLALLSLALPPSAQIATRLRKL